MTSVFDFMLGDSPAPGGGGDDLVATQADRFGVPSAIARALVGMESGGRDDAVSYKGARGRTQVMPDTMRELGFNPDTATPEDYTTAGMKYLRQQYDRFGSWDLALAAYHAGPGAVERAGGIPDTTDGITRTPDYVRRIMANAGIDPTVAAGDGGPSGPMSVYDMMLGNAPAARDDRAERDARAKQAMANAPVPLFEEVVSRPLRTGTERLGAGLSGLIGREAGVLASDLADVARVPRSAEQQAYEERLKAAGDAFDSASGFAESTRAVVDLIGAVFGSPRQAARATVESLASSSPAIGGAAAGALAGAATPIPGGSVIGGLIGYLGGSLATNTQVEMAARMDEKLRAAGVDTTDVQATIAALQQNPTIVPDSKREAIRAGLATTAVEGVIDLATFGAARVTKPARTIAGTLARGAGAVAAQGAGEGLGAAAGDAAAGDPANYGSNIAEGLLGMVPGMGEAAAAVYAGRRLPIAAALAEIGNAKTADEAVEAAARVLALPGPPDKVVSDWELVDDGQPPGPPGALPAPPGGAAPPLLPYQPAEPTIVADERGNARVMPAGAQSELDAARGDAQRRATWEPEEQALANRNLGLSPDGTRVVDAVGAIDPTLGRAGDAASTAPRGLIGGAVAGSAVPRESTAVPPPAPAVQPPADAMQTQGNAGDYRPFGPESGSLGVPRTEMPQVRPETHGPLVNFLKARGVESTLDEIPAGSLRPTQAEYSPAKVESARAAGAGDKRVLVSSDGYVVDGHHRWLAAFLDEAPVRVIRLAAPVRQLLDLVAEFPSSEQAEGGMAPPSVEISQFRNTEPTTPKTEGSGPKTEGPVSKTELSAAQAKADDALERLADLLQANQPTGGLVERAAQAPSLGAEPKLRERTPAQLSAQKRQREAYAQKNPFQAFLGTVGVSLALQKDITGETGRLGNRMVPYHGPIFKRDGLDIDALAERAIEAGFLSPADVADPTDNGGTRKLAEMIRRAQMGERILRAGDEYAAAEEAARSAFEDYEAVEGPADDPQAVEEAAIAVAEAFDDDELNALLRVTAAGAEDLDDAQLEAIADDGLQALIDEADAEEAGRAGEAAGAVAQGPDAGADAGRGEAGPAPRPTGLIEQAVAPPPADDFTLTGQTPDQVRADTARREREAAEKARRDAAPPPDDFVLSGSDRPVDQARARGQLELGEAPASPDSDLFGAPPPVSDAVGSKPNTGSMSYNSDRMKALRAITDDAKRLDETARIGAEAIQRIGLMRDAVASFDITANSANVQPLKLREAVIEKLREAGYGEERLAVLAKRLGVDIDKAATSPEAATPTTQESSREEGQGNQAAASEVLTPPGGREASRLEDDTADEVDEADEAEMNAEQRASADAAWRKRDLAAQQREIDAMVAAGKTPDGFEFKGLRYGAGSIEADEINGFKAGDRVKIRGHKEPVTIRSVYVTRPTRKAPGWSRAGVLTSDNAVTGRDIKDLVRADAEAITASPKIKVPPKKSEKAAPPAGSVEYTTPGTNLTWSDAAGWMDAAETLERRPPSSGKYKQQRAHMQALAENVKTIIDPLRDAQLLDKLRLKFISRNPVTSEATSEQRVAIINAVSRAQNAMGKAAAGNKPKIPAPPKAGSDEAKMLDAQAKAAKALDDLANLLGGKKNITPEQQRKLLPILVDLMDAFASMGTIKFKQLARKVLDMIRGHERMGPEVADQITLRDLQSAYLSVGQNHEGSDEPGTVFDVRSLDELGEPAQDSPTGAEDAPGSDPNLERDRLDAADGDEEVGTAVPAGAGGARPRSGRGGGGARGGRGSRPRDPGLPGPGTTTGREQGSDEVRGGDREPIASDLPAGVDESERVDDPRPDGVADDDVVGDEGAGGPGQDPGQVDKLRAQRAAQGIKVRPGDRANIDETLPFLSDGQRADVKFAEDRFAKDDGHGVLFTNQTGTGKTFSGLGIVKRFAARGRDNVLVIVPSDKITQDWVEAGRVLQLDIKPLRDTKDNGGSGIVITSYANAGDNTSLALRKWDLVVADEAHKLSENAEGEPTKALRAVRAVTGHPDGKWLFAQMRYPQEYGAWISASQAASAARRSLDTPDEVVRQLGDAEDRALAAWKKVEAKADAEFDRVAANRPKALFLSATPFAYEKNTDWAHGYLYDYGETFDGKTGYNRGSAQAQFMIRHFGYRMRVGKLTQPGPEVDSGLMQRNFNSWMKRQGVLSSRALDVPHDYDRRFQSVESAIGTRIDQALEWLNEDKPGRRALGDRISKVFDYLTRRRILESIKAEEVVPKVRAQLAAGRKVLVFHDYRKERVAFHPFVLELAETDVDPSTGVALGPVYEDFKREFKDLLAYPFTKQQTAIETLTREFPDALLFNGAVPKGTRRENVARFQADDGGRHLIIVQSAAGREGISLHDTTGKMQRVLYHLGLPTAPTAAIQQEGRIMRFGQASDAMFRYLNTGTSWERWAFATTIARRASAAENLAQGEEARGLLDSFVTAFESTGDFPPGHEGEGKGGKALDRALAGAISMFDRAKSFYFAQPKKTARTKSEEGVDYFATPEPLGLKMVEWAGQPANARYLEPSAGHGAIARWFPDTAQRTAIEPSGELSSRLALAFDAKIVRERFENHDIVNKYDAIVMNPPFGVGGKTAAEHLAKAWTHLAVNGRLVAIVPRGPAMERRLEKFYEETKGVHMVATLALPASTFERAGTSVAADVIVLQKRGPATTDERTLPQPKQRDWREIETIGEFFDRIQDFDLDAVQRPSDPASAPSRPDAGAAPSQAAQASDVGPVRTWEQKHGRTGAVQYMAAAQDRVERDVYDQLNTIAKRNNGYWSRYQNKAEGVKAGFVFPTQLDRQSFVDAAAQVMGDRPAMMRAPRSEAFKAWFGDSKVVDENGEPLVMYHGTGADIASFENSRQREQGNAGIYFTPSADYASIYATWRNGGDDVENGSVYPVYLKMERPKIIERETTAYSTAYFTQAQVDALRAEGYDGVINRRSNEYVVFSPEQIKSATGNRGTFDPANPDIRMARGLPTGGMPIRRLTKLVEGIRAKWANAPDIEVVATAADLPDRVRSEIAAQESGGAQAAPQGVYWQGTVYLVADQLATEGAVVETLLHESLGHYGLRGTFGATLNPFLDRIALARPAQMREKARAYGMNIADIAERRAVAEEILAEMAQASPELDLVQRVIAAIRAFLRDVLGLPVSWSDNDIIAKAILPARRFVEQGTDRAAVSGQAQGAAASVPNAPFYSELARQIGAAKFGAMPAGQWSAWLKSNAPKLGVKADEIEWSGLPEFLEMRGKERVTKDEILGFLDQDGVQMKEVMLGNNGLTPDEEQELNELDDLLRREFDGEDGVFDDTDRARMDALANKKGAGQTTKFSGWRYDKGAGGTDYREMLVTLPAATRPRFEEWVRKTYGSSNHWDDKDENEARDRYEQEFGTRAEPVHFRSSHWDQPNVLVHTRFDTRTDADGKRVLFVHEIQSDWGQKGRKAGFREDIPESVLQAARNDVEAARDELVEITREGKAATKYRSELRAKYYRMEDEAARHPVESRRAEAREAMVELERIRDQEADKSRAFSDRNAAAHARYDAAVERLRDLMNRGKGATPRAPFVTDTKSWVALAIKRLIRHAAETGHERIAFVTGEQAAETFDLSKHVSKIQYGKNLGDGTYNLAAYATDGTLAVTRKRITLDEVGELVGKEIAAKIERGEGDDRVSIQRVSGGDRDRELSGLDLKVGGEGQKAFYDKIVPAVARDVVKKLGGRVDVNKVQDGSVAGRWRVWYADTRSFSVHSFPTEAEAASYAKSNEGEVRPPARPTQVEHAAIDITPELRSKAMAGMPMFRRDERPAMARPAPAPTWDAPEPGWMDDVIFTLQDKQVDLKRVVQAIRAKGRTIADKWNAYLKEELYYGRTAKRVKDFLDFELRPLLTDMQLRGITIPEFEEFLHNRHAEERNAQIAKINPAMPDGGSGIDTADAQAYLAGLAPDRRRAFDALAARLDSITAGTRKTIVDGGLEKAETVKAWEGVYSSYVPLMRDEVEDSGPGTGQGFSVRGPSSKRALGSKKKVVDILANVAMQRERAITRVEKNRVSTALYGLAIKNPNPDFWKPVNPALFPAYSASRKAKLEAELIAMGLNPADAASIIREPTTRDIDRRTGLVTSYVNAALRGRDNVIALRVNGEDRFVFLNATDPRAKRMARTIKSLDAQELGVVLSGAATLSRWFASVNTQYNPIFGIVNLTRDVQSALFNLSTTPIAGKQAAVMGHTLSALRGIYADIRAHRAGKAPSSSWAQLWEEFQREGGQTGYRDMFANAEERAKSLQTEIEQIAQGKLRGAGRAIFNWLSDYNETLENATRLAAYKVALEQGMSKEQAASLAKNLTVNFNRKGNITQQAGALYAFFNASVQGTARMAETLKGPAGKKIIAGGLAIGVLQALALAAAGFDEREPPDFVRERNLVIPIGGDQYITIPMPLGLHVLPGISRITTEWALSGFKRPGDRMAQMLGMFIETFNPVGSAGFSMQTLAPTALDPLAALAENRDWQGRPIARENINTMQPKPGHLLARDTSPWYAKELSYWLNIASGGTEHVPGAISWSPDQIDYLVGQVTGGVGREASKAFQAAGALSSGEELAPYKIPLAGRFYGDASSGASERAMFYDNLKTVYRHKTEMDGRRKSGESVAAYMRDNPEARLVTAAGQIDRDIDDLRREKRDLTRAGASAEAVRRVDERMRARMRQFNERVAALSQ